MISEWSDRFFPLVLINGGLHFVGEAEKDVTYNGNEMIGDVVIPTDVVFGYLAIIDTSECEGESRKWLLNKQIEWAGVLHKVATKGVAVNPEFQSN